MVQVRGREHFEDGRVLTPTTLQVEGAGSDEDGEQPEFSLVTGKYRKVKHFGGVGPPVSGEALSAVVPRNNEGTVSVLRDSAAGAW